MRPAARRLHQNVDTTAIAYAMLPLQSTSPMRLDNMNAAEAQVCHPEQCWKSHGAIIITRRGWGQVHAQQQLGGIHCLLQDLYL